MYLYVLLSQTTNTEVLQYMFTFKDPVLLSSFRVLFDNTMSANKLLLAGGFEAGLICKSA